MTQLLPSSLRGSGAVLPSAMPRSDVRPSRPILDFSAHEDEPEEATALFDSVRGSGRPLGGGYGSADPGTLSAAGQPKKNTLARHSAAVEDDLLARAQLAGETGEYRARTGGRPSAAPPAHASRDVAPPPLPPAEPSTAAMGQAVVVSPSRRPPRSATSTASAFQRTEAEVPPTFAPSVRPVPKSHSAPLPGAPSSLPVASWTASGEQVAAATAGTGRRAGSWFLALGVATVLVVVGSAALLRNPNHALAASALADPLLPAHASAPTAELPAAMPSAAPVAAAPPVVPAAEAPPAYVPGAAHPAAPLEPVPDAPLAEPPTVAAKPEPTAHRGTSSRGHKAEPAEKAPPAPKPVAAPKPAKPEPAPTPKKPVAAAPVETPKKGKKGEQSDEERKASEEAARLARKQLDDQL